MAMPPWTNLCRQDMKGISWYRFLDYEEPSNAIAKSSNKSPEYTKLETLKRKIRRKKQNSEAEVLIGIERNLEETAHKGKYRDIEG